MDHAVLVDSAHRGDKRLGQHLPAEDPAERHPLADPGENVFAGAGAGVRQVERAHQAGKGVIHPFLRILPFRQGT